MAKITIGGEEYTVAEMNFMALERAWPFVEASMVSGGNDPMKGPLAAMRIIAAGIMEDENFQPERFKVTAKEDDPDLIHDQIVNFFRKKLKAKEIEKLRACVDDIMVEAGLAAPEGEDEPSLQGAETANLSPETAPASSQSS